MKGRNNKRRKTSKESLNEANTVKREKELMEERNNERN
jgi:hypothetical protein